MADHPVVNLHVFRLRSYSAGVFLMTVLGFVLYGSIVVIPIWLQTLLGYPAMATGFTMAPRGLGSMIGMPIIGMVVAIRPAQDFGRGLLLGAVSTWQLALLNLDVGYWDLFWPQAIQGFGLSMVFVPLTTISMNPVPREAMGNATSLFNLMRNLGGSMGIATVATDEHPLSAEVHGHSGRARRATSPQSEQWFGSLRSLYLSSGSGPGLADQQAYASLFGMVQRQAAMRAFVDVFQFSPSRFC